MTPREILAYAAHVLFKRKITIVVVFLFTVAAFGFGTFLIAPQWCAPCRLLIGGNPTQQVIVFDKLHYPNRSASKPSVDMVEILISEDLAGKVVRKHRLDELLRQKAQNPKDFREKTKLLIVNVLKSPITLAIAIGLLPDDPPNFFAKAVEELIEDMQDIELIEGTSTIQLDVYAESPELAMGIADTMRELLSERVREFDSVEASETYDVLQEHVITARAALEEEEDKLLALMERNDVVDFETQKTHLLTRLDQVTGEIHANEKEITGLKALLAELERHLSSQNGLASARGDDRAGELLRFRNSLDENESERQVVATRTAIEERNAVSEALRRELAELQSRADELPGIEYQLEKYKRLISGLSERYLAMRGKFLELEAQRFIQTPEFDIKLAAAPYIPEGAEPDWPIWPLNLAVGIAAGIFLSVGLAFFLEYWVDSVETPKQVQELLGLPVIGEIPKMSMRGLSKRAAVPRERRTAAGTGVDDAHTAASGTR